MAIKTVTKYMKDCTYLTANRAAKGKGEEAKKRTGLRPPLESSSSI